MSDSVVDAGAISSDRRWSVLDSALVTFARFGYRKTSMDEVARAAHISRPGLYFLFASKEALFRASVTQTLEGDIASVEQILGEADRPLRDRLLDAFDRWAGRYIGAMARDITSVIDENPHLLGDITETAPRRFAELVAQAVERDTAGTTQHAAAVSQTVISTSVGLKHQVDTRDEYRQRLAVAIALVLS